MGSYYPQTKKNRPKVAKNGVRLAKLVYFFLLETNWVAIQGRALLQIFVKYCGDCRCNARVDSIGDFMVLTILHKREFPHGALLIKLEGSLAFKQDKSYVFEVSKLDY